MNYSFFPGISHGYLSIHVIQSLFVFLLSASLSYYRGLSQEGRKVEGKLFFLPSIFMCKMGSWVGICYTKWYFKNNKVSFSCKFWVPLLRICAFRASNLSTLSLHFLICWRRLINVFSHHFWSAHHLFIFTNSSVSYAPFWSSFYK